MNTANEYLNRVVNSIRGLFGGARDKAMEQVYRLSRQTMVAKALSFYSGLAPKQLKVKSGEPDDNVYINYAEVISQGESRDGGKVFTPVGVDVTWNSSFAPIFHAKNLPNPKCTYGKPDLTEQVLAVIAYISRLDSMCGKIVRIHSSPKPYAKNLKKQDLEWGTDGMLFLKPTGTQLDAEIGLLEMQNDISTALSLRKVLREGLAEMTGVPEVATGKVESTGQLSGVALRILYGPLLAKTALKQLRYGRMIVECVRALLAIGGLKGAVKLNWPDPLPGDEKEKVDVAEGKKRLGISEATLQKELGYNHEHEREQRQFDSQDMASAMLGAFDKGVGMEGALR